MLLFLIGIFIKYDTQPVTYPIIRLIRIRLFDLIVTFTLLFLLLIPSDSIHKKKKQYEIIYLVVRLVARIGLFEPTWSDRGQI